MLGTEGVAAVSMSELTLEKLQIAERLGAVESEIKALVELKKLEHTHMVSLLERVTKTIYGNGSEGLTTVVSKHTQSLMWLTRVMWSMAASLIALGVKAMFDKLVGT